MSKTENKHVIIRTYSAGVHYGEIVDRREREVTLANARRIWSWKGANTLHEISLHGVGAGSKVSEAVDRIILTEAIEIIDCAPDAIAAFKKSSWAK
jgi:hypothetical protein